MTSPDGSRDIGVCRVCGGDGTGSALLMVLRRRDSMVRWASRWGWAMESGSAALRAVLSPTGDSRVNSDVPFQTAVLKLHQHNQSEGMLTGAALPVAEIRLVCDRVTNSPKCGGGQQPKLWGLTPNQRHDRNPLGERPCLHLRSGGWLSVLVSMRLGGYVRLAMIDCYDILRGELSL